MPRPATTQRTTWLALTIKSIAAGDELAEMALCDFLLPGLRIIAQRRTNTLQGENIALDAMVAVLEEVRLGGLRSPKAIAALARRIVLKLSCPCVKQTARTRANQNVDDSLARLGKSSRSTAEKAAAKWKHLSLAREVLAELNPTDREVLRRFYVEEHMPEQICADMGLTVMQFQNARSRANKRLAELQQQQFSQNAPQTKLMIVGGRSSRCA
jgi:DNA-directed RNA polymerase specialized sigma24 family protein